MGPMQKNMIIIFTSFAAVMAALTLLVATSIWSQTEQVDAEVEQDTKPIRSIDTPEAFMAVGGGRAAVVMERPTNDFQVSRGQSTTASIVLKTLAAGDSPSQFVNIQVSGPKGTFLYPSDLAATTTEEQRMEAAMTGRQIPGSIDLNAFVTVDAANANMRVDSNQNKVVQVQLSVPKDFPDSMVGKTFEIPIIITATDDAGNPDTVYVEGSYVVLEVMN